MFASFMCAGYHFHIQIDWYRSLISFSNRRHTYSKKERQVACKTAIEIPFHHHRVSLCNTLTMPKFSKQTDVTTMLGISILFFLFVLLEFLCNILFRTNTKELSRLEENELQKNEITNQFCFIQFVSTVHIWKVVQSH